MSITRERSDYATREEIVEYLKRRIEELEEEIRILRSILASIAPDAVAGEEETLDPSERVEEVKVGRRVIGKLGVGEEYVRVKLSFPVVLPGEVRQYLESVVEEIREKQAVKGLPPEERAQMEIIPGPEGGVRQIRVTNLYSTLDKVRVKAALKYAAEIMYQIHRKRGEEE